MRRVTWTLDNSANGLRISMRRRGKTWIIYHVDGEQPKEREAEALRAFAYRLLGAAGGYEFAPDNRIIDLQVEKMLRENGKKGEQEDDYNG